jgi:hypothetical protein
LPGRHSPVVFKGTLEVRAAGDNMRFTTRSLALAIACLGLSTLLVSPAFAQGDPQVGVWKLNVAKSKYTPGPVPKAGTTKIEAAGRGVKVVVDQTLPDGTERHFEFTANYDGKDSPVTGNYPDADTVARTKINANTVQTINKKGGKVTTTQTSEVSADGKTRTVTTRGITANGQKVNNVAVYDKQ